jgi:hypothetical protein
VREVNQTLRQCFDVSSEVRILSRIVLSSDLMIFLKIFLARKSPGSNPCQFFNQIKFFFSLWKMRNRNKTGKFFIQKLCHKMSSSSTPMHFALILYF